jgi:hypothetical protein
MRTRDELAARRKQGNPEAEAAKEELIVAAYRYARRLGDVPVEVAEERTPHGHALTLRIGAATHLPRGA